MSSALIRAAAGVVTGLALAGGASAQVIYNSITVPSGRVYSGVNFGDAAYDDLRVTSGGQLSTITIAGFGGGFGFGDVMTGYSLHLYLDDGDGVPQVNPGSEGVPPPVTDTHLLSLATGEEEFVTFTRGEVSTLTIDVSGLNAVVPAGGGLIWAGLEFSNSFSMSHPFFAAPTVGSTDSRVWTFTNGFQDVPAVHDSGAPGAQALGWRLEIVPAPGAAGVLVAGACALARRRRR